MQGYNALWLPGSDHASISTEMKVVQKLKKEGKTIICVTHDEKMAKSADRIIDLKKERGSEK